MINCEKYDDIISKNSGDIGKTMLVEMEIDTGNHPPIASKPYTLSLKHYEWVQREIETLEREVMKADGGKGCISLIPLPKFDELYAKLKGYKVFSSLDLRSGYYYIGLTESAKPKSAFVLSSLSKYQFNRVPFGPAQAAAYFQELINDVSKGCNFTTG